LPAQVGGFRSGRLRLRAIQAIQAIPVIPAIPAIPAIQARAPYSLVVYAAE
jgi:hypothetical protein